jgi:hypothetical protein
MISRRCLLFSALAVLSVCGTTTACDGFAKSGMSGMPMAGFGGGKAMPVASGGLYVPAKYAQKAMLAKMAKLEAGGDGSQLAKSRKTRFGGVDSMVAKQAPLRFDGAALKRSEIADLKAAAEQATLARVSDAKLGRRGRK